MLVEERRQLKKLSGINTLSSEVQALYWTAPQMWPNSTIFILGGGPSIKNLDLTKIQGKWPIIGCNMAFLDYPWIDVMYFGDCKVHMWISGQDNGKYTEQFDAFQGLKVSCCPDTREDPRIHALFRHLKGIIRERRSIGWNLNTGGSAINLAYHFGARRIVLLGFDMKQINNRQNFHDYNLEKDKHPDENYKKFIRYFERIAKDAKELELEVINATPGSALPYFPIISYEEVLKTL